MKKDSPQHVFNDTSVSQEEGMQVYIHRLKVYGGWIVTTTTQQYAYNEEEDRYINPIAIAQSSCFVPDPGHQGWILEDN